MNDIINFLGLIPIIIYYLLESFLFAIFTNFTWKFFLFDLFKIEIKYMQWVGIIWIVKLLYFNVFALIPIANNLKKENKETNNEAK